MTSGRHRVQRISSSEDPCLACFRDVADPVLVRRKGLFVAEGRRVVAEVLRGGGGYEIEGVFLSEAAHNALADDLAQWFARVPSGVPSRMPVYVVVTPAAIKAVTGYRFHQGCLALVKRPAPRGLDDLPGLLAPGRRLVVALEGVSDPDNVGTIFRSARAFGADAVLLSPGCAYPLYRKALRTSMGAALHLPFAHPEAWSAALERLRASDFVLVAATPASDARLLDTVGEVSATSRTVLLLGSEQRGLSARTLAEADLRVRIPTREVVDSLNVAATAAILLYRWRTHGTD